MKNTENLMKHFASVLRGRAIGTQKAPSISSTVAKYFSRRELIEIIKNRFGGTIPKEHNLVEMENSELLQLIGDEMYIISYMTEKWCGKLPQISNESLRIVKKQNPKNTNNKKKNDTIPK